MIVRFFLYPRSVFIFLQLHDSRLRRDGQRLCMEETTDDTERKLAAVIENYGWTF